MLNVTAHNEHNELYLHLFKMSQAFFLQIFFLNAAGVESMNINSFCTQASKLS